MDNTHYGYGVPVVQRMYVQGAGWDTKQVFFLILDDVKLQYGWNCIHPGK